MSSASGAAALPAAPTRRSSRRASVRCASASDAKGGTQKQRLYIGKGRFVEDDPRKYPGREENNAAGGWAGGEKALQAFREELRAEAPRKPEGKPARKPAQLPPSLDVQLAKDFGGAAGGFPGGEVGVKSFVATGKVPKPARKPTVGLGGYAAVAVAGAYAACVTATGDFNPRDWEVVVGGGGGGGASAPSERAEAAGKRQARPNTPRGARGPRAARGCARRRAACGQYLTPPQLVLPSLPPVDPVLLKAVAPPAAAVGGAVALAVGTQAAVRSLLDGVRRAAVISLFAAAVGAVGAHILGLI